MTKRSKHHQSSSLVSDIRQLLGYMSRQRQRQLGLLIVLMLVSALSEMISIGAIFPFLRALSNAEELLNTQALQPIFSSLNIQTSGQLVIGLAVVFILAVAIANGLRILTIYARTHLAADIAGDLSCQLYDKTLLQPYSFHVQHNSSDLIQTVTGDTRRLSNGVMVPLLALITNSFVVLALVGGLFLVDAPVALLLATVFGCSYAGLYHLRRNVLRRNSHILVESSQQQIKMVQEGLGGIRDVLIGGTQEFFQSSYEKADRPFRHANASNVIISQTPRYLIEAVAMTAIGLLALSMGRNGDFSQVLPVLGSLALGANRLLPVVQQSFAALVQIQGARTSLQRILLGLQRPVDPMQMWVPSHGLALEKELQFDHIWFHYGDEDAWVLQDLNLRIAARTTVGFVGSTGSGKSTTADMLLGLLKPQQGVIWVDGEPLQGERLRQWQKSIAHVPQSIFLTDATIAENIAFGVPREQIDVERVHRAAQLAQIDDYIQELPARYETYVGERGVRLSGGQRQRIGIARALYQQASVIVFDEATSALDNTTEKEVMAAINGLNRQFTIILIAHRLSTVEKCDRIYELHKGQVIAEGTYEELKAKSVSFRNMLASSSNGR